MQLRVSRVCCISSFSLFHCGWKVTAQDQADLNKGESAGSTGLLCCEGSREDLVPWRVPGTEGLVSFLYFLSEAAASSRRTKGSSPSGTAELLLYQSFGLLSEARAVLKLQAGSGARAGVTFRSFAPWGTGMGSLHLREMTDGGEDTVTHRATVGTLGADLRSAAFSVPRDLGLSILMGS